MTGLSLFCVLNVAVRLDLSARLVLSGAPKWVIERRGAPPQTPPHLSRNRDAAPV